ncbi:YjbE family putative metal transport protein [Candidatus Puniceispirillum sp.]|nr:YjbE family putative metal transport protein [Candidatus Puniceispirillum sp.]
MSIVGLDVTQYGFTEVTDIFQIIFADIILSGDNALVIGMAAAGLTAAQRKRAIAIGMAVAALLRIIFAVIAAQLLAIKGILLIGGGLLAWVCYRFYQDLKEFNNNAQNLADEGAVIDNKNQIDEKGFGRALFTILVADFSMSIDNIVAVAAIARDNTTLLILGLALAIAFMAFSASLIMKIMIRYQWLSYLGLWFLIYLTVKMLHDGLVDLGFIAVLF